MKDLLAFRFGIVWLSSTALSWIVAFQNFGNWWSSFFTALLIGVFVSGFFLRWIK